MKFSAAIVILALAIGANASAIPLGPSLTVTEPWGVKLVSVQSGWNSHSDWDDSGAWAPKASWAEPAVWSAPAAWAVPHAAAVVVAAAAPAPEGKYIAANRGSVHEAPLPGHTQSAKALNLQPAPGTW